MDRDGSSDATSRSSMGPADQYGQSGPSGLLLRRSITRLPWLDGAKSSRNLPGEYDTELRDLTGGESHLAGAHSSPDLGSRPSAPKSRLSIGSLPDVPGSFNRKGGEYTPSTYSGSRRADRDTGSHHTFPKKDATSYERLVEKPFDQPRQTHAPIIPPRVSGLVTHESPPGHVAVGESQDGNIGLAPIPRTRSFDGNLSSDAPSGKRPHHPHHRRQTLAVHPHEVPEGSHTRSSRSPSMGETLSNLRGLMTEAMNLAEEAEKQNRTDDMATIFREASLAMRSASRIGGQMKSPLQLSDMELSPTSEEYTADSSSSNDGSELSIWPLPATKQTSEETIPTEYSTSPRFSSPSSERPQKSMSTAPDKLLALPTTDLLSDSEISPGTAPAHVRPRSTQLGLPTALRLSQPPSADSIVIDFAYVDRQPTTSSINSATANPRKTRHRSHGRRKQVFQEDVDANPEDVVQSPVRPIAKEEPVPKLIYVDPDPIMEPVMTVAGGPKRRKTRKRSTLRQPYNEAGDQRNIENISTMRETVIIPVSEPVTSTQPVVNVAFDAGAPDSNEPVSHFKRLKYKRRPIAREWGVVRKRITAIIACINTALIGLIAGIYAGEVPKIQYQIADFNRRVILGNVFFYLGLGISTLITWPLPLLHGRKLYILVALALTLPLQFPQAISVSQFRSPDRRWYVALLLPRALSGLILGFANVNFLATLLDLFGASLQAHHPHQELVDSDDIRRQGGGVGLWLGLWSWCFVGSLAVGFLIGAIVTDRLPPAWGFYFVVILLAIFLMMNIVAPETRRAPHRRSILHYLDEEDVLQRKIARGEVKLHLAQDGPQYWWEEVHAGLRLMKYMVSQPGFAILALYLAWIYALVVLVTLLLGALLSTNYLWTPQYVGLGVFALAVGAALAVPMTKANLLSRDRSLPARTDSMTFQPRVTWSSHLVRRCIFTFTLPLAGLAFTLTSPGPSLSWAAPTIMSAAVGFLATLAIAECVGLTMETYDTCDLQPGANTRHRLQSMDSRTRRRRTNYSSFPRVIAGLFASQGLGFFLAAAATGVSGTVTRALGAQAATGVVAGILLFLTILLSFVLWRFRTIPVIPNHAFGTKKGSKDWTADDDDKF